ncbi:MAG: hypothetical protein PHU25_06520 [Deltaproteobacteria bacterium]|nr:hypothetical protein [Deltaproteobacteria bacterium]
MHTRGRRDAVLPLLGFLAAAGCYHVETLDGDDPASLDGSADAGAGNGTGADGFPVDDPDTLGAGTSTDSECVDRCGIRLGGVDCGACRDGFACLDLECFWIQGPPPPTNLWADDVLMRGLYDDGGEGQRFTVQWTGLLRRVEAALWTEWIPGDQQDARVTLDIYAPDDGVQPQLLAEKNLPASSFPAYAGCYSECRTTFFDLEPPVPVRRDQTIDVVFSGWSQAYDEGAVSGIYMSDLDPGSEVVLYNGGPGIDPQPGWDYMTRIYLQ